MNKKYCIIANTNYIRRDIKPINIKFSFCGNTLEKAIRNFEFDFEFTHDFFRHVQFYEIYFNDKNQPISGHCLGKEKDDFNCPNGWIDFNEHFTKINFCNFFLMKQNNEKFFQSNGELFESLLKWAKESANYLIKEYIIDMLEYGEE